MRWILKKLSRLGAWILLGIVVVILFLLGRLSGIASWLLGMLTDQKGSDCVSDIYER